MKRTRGENILMWTIFAVFVIYSVSLIFPFLWTLNNSFKTSNEFFNGNLWWIPKDFTFANYSNVFSIKAGKVTIGGMFGNSILIVAVGTALGVMSSSVGAYVVSKYHFKGRNFIYGLAIVIMLIPTTGSLSATFKLMNDTGLYNSYIGVFLMYAGGFGFNFILLYGYFRSVSWAYAEAAMVDGASDFKVFLRIMLPQAAPALTAVGIITAINIWNDFFTVYMFAPKLTTVSVGLNTVVQAMSAQSDYPQLFAFLLLTVVPVIIIFVVFQKTIMENTVAGGLKG